MASKKNLVILLVMPFVVSLLSFTVINMAFNLIDNDIIDIAWEYNTDEAFALRADNTKYPLNAIAINDRNYPTNQQLVWNVYNEDGTSEPYARIEVDADGNAYLITLHEGVVIVTCSNDKGNVQKSVRITIYADTAILLNPTMAGSSSNVDKNVYFGQFDLVNGSRSLSSFTYDLSVYTPNNDSDAEIIACSNNITYDNSKKLISFKYGGTNKVEDAFVTLAFTNKFYPQTYDYNFKIVTNGINVYTYDDLLNCTNKSTYGEIMVLRKNFENSANLSDKNKNNTVLFGHQNTDGTFNFANDVYHFETNYNQEYITQWNEFARSSGGKYSTISNIVNAGLRIQKDVYGNGFTINLHNLTYPYATMTVLDNDSNTQLVPKLNDANIFRGPLPYYTLGDPNNLPLVTAYGQDNIGIYVNGNDITINDIVVKNCDFGNNLANLDTVGTVLETRGNNITIKNSRLSNGKNIVRTFDSKNVLIDNCMLSYSRNFLLSAGSYDYLKVDGNRAYQFIKETDGKPGSLSSLNKYLATDADGDKALENYMMGVDNGHLLEAMRSIQKGLDNASTNTFKGEVTINDTLFYRSGIASIGLESLFNGTFLFNGTPSMIGRTFNSYADQLDQYGFGIPLFPSNIGGVSYPVKVHLTGKTKFYEYKASNNFDIDGLVGESISTIIKSLGLDVNISLDTIFPIKTVLMELSSDAGATYQGEISVPVAYYGGGLNLSVLDYSDDFTMKEHLTDTLDVDFLGRYAQIGNQGAGMMANAVGIMLKSVTVVAGFNPFKFILGKDGYLHGETPKVQILIDNSK